MEFENLILDNQREILYTDIEDLREKMRDTTFWNDYERDDFVNFLDDNYCTGETFFWTDEEKEVAIETFVSYFIDSIKRGLVDSYQYFKKLTILKY